MPEMCNGGEGGGGEIGGVGSFKNEFFLLLLRLYSTWERGEEGALLTPVDRLLQGPSSGQWTTIEAILKCCLYQEIRLHRAKLGRRRALYIEVMSIMSGWRALYRSDVWVWRWGVMDVTRRINEQRSFQLQGPPPPHQGGGGVADNHLRNALNSINKKKSA